MEKYILRQEQIDAYEGVDKAHFLNDQARRVNKSLGDLTGLTGFGFHLVYIEPGQLSTEFHRHYFEDECVYILHGEAEARIGEDVYDVRAGDFIGYPAGGDAHTLKNTGSETLKMIVVGARQAHDVADYPDRRKRIFRNQGQPWNLVDIENITEPVAGKKI